MNMEKIDKQTRVIRDLLVCKGADKDIMASYYKRTENGIEHTLYKMVNGEWVGKPARQTKDLKAEWIDE